MGWQPVVQDHFAPDDKTVAEMLHRRIRECDAVVHIVGECYGAEPKATEKDGARRSYTQIEAEIARKLRKRLFTVLLDEQFPFDSHEPEAAELRDLQQAYRRDVATSNYLYIPCRAPSDFETEIRKLRIEIDKLRKSRLVTALVLSISLIAAIGVGFYSWHSRQRDVRDVLEQVIRQTQDQSADHSPEAQKELLHAAVYKVAAESGMDPDALTKRVDEFVVETAANHAASLKDRAIAAFAQGDHAAAEKLADEAAGDIEKGPGDEEFKRPLVRDMLMLAADAAANQSNWTQAETYSRRALEDSKPDTEAETYATNGLSLANDLLEQQRFGEAADAIVRAKAAIGGQLASLGDTGPDLLNSLAAVQLFSHRLADSEATLEESIRLAASGTSRPSPQTAFAYTLLAGVLDRLDRQTEAGEARRKADAVIAAARARSADYILAEQCEISVERAAQALTAEETLKTNEAQRALDARMGALSTVIRALSSATDSESRAFDIVDRVGGILAILVIAAFVYVCFPLCKLQWRVWKMERTFPKRPRGSEEITLSDNPEIRRQQREQIIQDIDAYRRTLELRIENRDNIMERLKGTSRKLAGVSAVALLLGIFGFTDRGRLAETISGEPQIWSHVVTEVRSDADFTDKAFGPVSEPHIEMLGLLAQLLEFPPKDKLRYEAEAEDIYKRVISSRQVDAHFSREELAKLMEDLAEVLKTEGKNSESDGWIRRAHNVRVLPVSLK